MAKLRSQVGFNSTYVDAELEKQFNDRSEAKQWIIANQLARRNLTPEKSAYMLGKLYEERKHQGARTDLTSRQNDEKLKTSEKIANEYNISSRTIERAVDFATAIDTIEQTVGQQTHGGDRKSDKKSSRQNDEKLKTSEKIANEYNLGSRTIERAVDFATAVDTIEQTIGQQTHGGDRKSDKNSIHQNDGLIKTTEFFQKLSKATIFSSAM